MSDPNQVYQQYQPPQGYGPQAPAAKGKTTIKVSGILMIILGTLGVALTGLGMLGSIGLGLGGVVVLLMFYELVVAALTLAFGICGVLYAARPEKGQTIATMGTAICVMKVVDLVAAIMLFGSVEASTVFGVILGIVLPVLYIVGGTANKNGMAG